MLSPLFINNFLSLQKCSALQLEESMGRCWSSASMRPSLRLC